MRIASIGLFLFIFAGCGPTDYPAMEVKVNRFEADLQRVNVNNLEADIKALREKDPLFFRVYVEGIMEVGPISDTMPIYLTMLERYLGNEAIQGLLATTQEKYPDLNFLEEGLGVAFYRLKELYPSFNPPQVYSFISEFYYGAITYDTTILAVGLDMYLGSDYKYYPAVNKPAYQIRKLERPYMVPNAVNSLLNNKFPLPTDREQFIDKLVYEGKMIYLMKHLMPEIADSVLLGYKQVHVDWCKASEASIWAFLIDRELLFSTNNQQYFRYFTDGPTTTDMHPDSPGYISKWVGWQIVKQYMERSGVSIQELMSNNDGRSILEGAAYRPK
jgi:hypothetical protein